MTHPDDTVQEVVTDHAVPLKKDMWADRGFSREKKALWTPNLLFLEPDGEEWYRNQGYLPPEEYIARFLTATGIYYMQTRQLEKSASCLETVASEYPETDAAPKARYYSGVCQMRIEKDIHPIYEACSEVLERWPDSIWATKLEFTRNYDDFYDIDEK